jgi:hypothetical protein
MNIAYLPGRKAIRSGDYVVHAGIPRIMLPPHHDRLV